jgi:hypothetical protein
MDGIRQRINADSQLEGRGQMTGIELIKSVMVID